MNAVESKIDKSKSEKRRAIYAISKAKQTSDDCRVVGKERRPALIAAQQTGEKLLSINSDCVKHYTTINQIGIDCAVQLRTRECISYQLVQLRRGESFEKEESNGQRHNPPWQSAMFPSKMLGCIRNTAQQRAFYLRIEGTMAIKLIVK